MTIGSTQETSMSYLFSPSSGKRKKKRNKSIFNVYNYFLFKDEDEKDFEQWKNSISIEARMPGGLSSETRQKVGKYQTIFFLI